MDKDVEDERRAFMQKPVPATPKGARPALESKGLASPPPFDEFARKPPPVQHTDAFGDFAHIVKILRKHPKPMQQHIIGVLADLLLD